MKIVWIGMLGHPNRKKTSQESGQKQLRMSVLDRHTTKVVITSLCKRMNHQMLEELSGLLTRPSGV